VKFEWDSAKSDRNQAKHGISFGQAVALWDGAVVSLKSHQLGELRQLVIGHINGKTWTAIITERGETIRIISVRRSRETEEQLYEKNKN
jgi:uncharacterized DUF497 family protein